MSTAGRLQAASAVVRRLNAAVKSRRLYGPGHPLRAQTISALLGTVAAYHERYGSFVLETHRQGLVIEGRLYEGGESVDNLALQLYAMGIWQLVLVPGMSEEETGELLEIVSLEREAITEAGGLVALLASKNIEHIHVVELRPGEDDASQITPEVYQQLLDGSLSAHERGAILGLLRAGSDNAARLVGVVVERTRQAFPEARGEELAEHIYQALTALDRLIADTPPGESQELLKSLASAVAAADDPTKGGLPKTILASAGQDLSARALLSAMTSEQIARMVIPCLEAGDPPPQAGQLVQGLPFDPEKARETLALISQQTGRSIDVPALLEEMTLPRWIHNFPQDLEDFRIDAQDVVVSDDEVQALLSEAQVDDVTLAREHALLLLHLAAGEEDPRELDAALDGLVRAALGALQRNEFDFVETTLRELDALAVGGGARAEAVRAGIRAFLTHLPGMLTLKDVWLWTEEHALLRCLRPIAATAGALLAQALAAERDPARRQVIAAILAKLGDETVDALAPHLTDSNVEAVRHVIQALGHMRSVKAARALRGVAGHTDPKLRREAIEALRGAGLPQAQETLLAFVRDPDLSVREYVIAQLRPEVARAAIRDLVAMLQARETVRAAALRIQILDTLVRARATDTVPVLRRLGSPFRLRARDRAVARHARAAVAALSKPASARPATSGVAR